MTTKISLRCAAVLLMGAALALSPVAHADTLTATSSGNSLEARSEFKPPSFCKPLRKADAAREKAKDAASWGSAEHKRLARDYARYTNRGAKKSPEQLAAWLKAVSRVYVAEVYSKQPSETDMDLAYGAKNWFIPVVVEMCGFDPWR